MKPTKFTLTEPEYRALRLKAEEAKRLRRAMLRLRRMCVAHRATKNYKYPTCGWFADAEAVVDRALARRKR